MEASPTYVIQLWIVHGVELCQLDTWEALQVLRFMEKLVPAFFIEWARQLVFISF